jgi:two-component system, LuxR family, response regulator FixJ
MTSGAPRKVLVVDRSREAVDAIRGVLEGEGYHVEGVDSTRKALKRLSDANFDLVITDVHMPDVSGLELLKRIKTTIREDIPVILITGLAEAEHAIEAVRLGAADFLGKPVDANTLLRAVKQQLTKSRNHLAKDYSPRYLASFQVNFKFSPQSIQERNIASIALSYLQKLYDLPASVYNPLLLCLDEMLHNAFLHGALGLSKTERCLPQAEYRALVDSRVDRPGVRDQFITLSISLDPVNQLVRMVVTDQGSGFDYQPYMKAVDHPLNLEGTGRGINFIRMMTDRVAFSNGGRTITVEKSFAKP